MTRKRSTSSRKNTTGSKSSSRRSTSTRRNRSRSNRSRLDLSLDGRQKAIIVGIFLIFLTAILALSLLSPNQGQLTTFLADGLWQLFGWGGVLIPIALGVTGFYLVLWGMNQPPNLPQLQLAGLLLLFLAAEALVTLIVMVVKPEMEGVTAIAEAGEGGGYLGGGIVWLLSQAVGQLGATFVLLIAGVIAVILATGVSRDDMGLFLREVFTRKEKPAAEREIPVNRGGATVSTAPSRASEPPSAANAPTGVPTTSTNPAQPATQTAATKRRSRRRKGAQPQTAPTSTANQDTAEATPVFFTQTSGQNWTLPKVNELLESGGEQEVGSATIREQVEIIEHTLESFGAPATVVEISQGPTITQYGVEPNFIVQRSGKRTKVKVGKIAGLGDDLALALAARSIRIQAPVPGKGYVGIEVPNPEKALVSLRDVMEAAEFTGIQSPLRIGLGQNVGGQPIAADLTQMPHLLIAGTTGSGKSVCVNGIVACLLLQNTPETLKLVMVDPKRVELTGYNGIPHLVAPVVVDLERVVGTLQWALREMDNRYKRLADIGARNIDEYNRKVNGNGQEPMPYIVIVIDELADLMMLSPEETERGITRLAQMARATGIHMVIATQRPSVDVVTGLIKANFPARIAFAVASSTDSRVILDTTGAERLLGQGDMLFQSPDAAAPIRMQGCFVSESELTSLIRYWQSAMRFSSARATPAAESEQQPDEPADSATGLTTVQKPAVEETAQKPAAEKPTQQPLWEELQVEEEQTAKYEDELLPEAIALVRQLGKASTSLLQRRFRIGYTRAARMMDVMEEDGIIGPPTGTSKAREVLPWREDKSGPSSENGADQE
ncbi:MAG TPA: DNA translocase FtsK 4TM domain-containing protein [Anaerolineae bacterium]|jgi:S-DNA-T family DNA segregation ATPase FtsK/SpoIIIE|nr:DNA translocase FtsK 4TM domain-containing protein [Anaerolineae bacterium]